MNIVDDRPFISWLILVYDRTAEERFPFKRKWYRFNYDRATETEAQEVIRLCQQRKDDRDIPGPKPGIGQTRVSFQIGGSVNTDRRIIDYRHLFDYVPEVNKLREGIKDPCAYLSVNLAHDSYFEDEDGKPISLMQAFDEEAKRNNGPWAFAIVLDRPESILRIGPAAPIRPELWNEDDADLMAQLSDVHGQLARSRWLASRAIVSPLGDGKFHAILPVHEDCMAVILPFRQLYSKDSADDLFNRTCKVHNRHCPKAHPTYSWVDEYQKQFNALLEAPVGFPLQGCPLPGRRYLDAFAYGASVVHASSKKDDPSADLDTLLAAFRKPMVVMGYHALLRSLLQCVFMATPVMWMNVNNWVGRLGWAGPKKPKGSFIFGT